MGNDFCTFSNIYSRDFIVPNLKERSVYKLPENLSKANQDLVKSIFAQSQNYEMNSKLLTYINNNGKVFNDEKFKVDSKETSRLAILFNFQNKQYIWNTYNQNDTELISLGQSEIQFAYISSVFYFYCKQKKMLQKTLFTKQPNQTGIYATSFHCKGQETLIIIDDKIPTNNDSYAYTRICQGNQFWPLLLEKAWCKMIGGYLSSKGLSPEDAFQEITGIPTYTYAIHQRNMGFIINLLQNSLKKKYWVTLIARKNLSDLRDRHVFYLSQRKDENKYLIISPYANFFFENYKQQGRGQVLVEQRDILTHFQYVTIGYYQQNYEIISIPIQVQSTKQLVVQIYVKSLEIVSIRFQQLYGHYLNEEERINYKYSPVMMELYKLEKGKYIKMPRCQGCPRSLSGARSVQLTSNIFFELPEGRYYLRINIDWAHENVLNKGNLVLYNSPDKISTYIIKDCEKLIRQIYNYCIQSYGSQAISISEHNLQMKTWQKSNSIVLYFKNILSTPQQFQLDFSLCQNTKIKYGELKKNKLLMTLDGEQHIIYQVIPEILGKPMTIQNLDISKLIVKDK